uniref:Uncharacterized protein n=1 Tax=Rhizophora mucronata TaxID=61149 RepID=A0A2P2QEE6_RHIMU
MWMSSWPSRQSSLISCCLILICQHPPFVFFPLLIFSLARNDNVSLTY